MKTMNLGWTLAIAALVGGCDVGGTNDDKTDDTSGTIDSGDTDTVDTDDTDTTVGPPEWNTGAWAAGWESFVDCSAGSVMFTAETNNWGYDAELYIEQTKFDASGAWSEQHTLAENGDLSSDEPDGYSVYERELSTGVLIANQTADESTIFTCSADSDPPNDADPGTLEPGSANFQVTFAIAVWAEGDSPATDDPADCIVFGDNPDELLGTDPDDSGTRPDWLTSGNCSEFN